MGCFHALPIFAYIIGIFMELSVAAFKILVVDALLYFLDVYGHFKVIIVCSCFQFKPPWVTT